MTTGLHEFLTARLDEDHAAAIAATSGPWTWDVIGHPGRWHTLVHANAWDVADCTGGEPHPGKTPPQDEQKKLDAQHIARWDPARVLAEVGAKRAVLEEHQDANADDYSHSDFALPPICGTCHDYTAHDAAAWPCATVRALAVVYAGHPDYQAEWGAL